MERRGEHSRRVRFMTCQNPEVSGFGLTQTEPLVSSMESLLERFSHREGLMYCMPPHDCAGSGAVVHESSSIRRDT